jgi:hypothetical protein
MYDSIVGHLVRRGVHMGSKCKDMHELKDKISSAPAWIGNHNGGHHHGMGHHTQEMGHVSGHHPFGHGGKLPEGAEDLFNKFLEKLNSPQAIFTIAGTVIALLLLDFLIAYAVGTIATNLAIAEDADNETTGSIKLPVGGNLDVKEPLLEARVANDFAPTVPITASLRKTLQHIRSIGGVKSLFRGFHFSLFFFVINSIFFVFTTAIFTSFLGHGFFGRFFSVAASRVITSNLHAAWTHATVTAPSEATKGFFKRFVPRTVSKHFILPTIRQVLAMNIVMFSVHSSSRLVHHLTMTRGAGDPIAAFSIALPVVLGLAGFFGLIVPTYIALVRMELAHMPEEMTAIVPFDRTFGGKFGGKTTGFANAEETEEEPATCARGRCPRRKGYVFRNLAMPGAYLSIDRSVYKRVLKMFVKAFVLHAALYVSAVTILSTEMYMFAGKEMDDIAAAFRK